MKKIFLFATIMLVIGCSSTDKNAVAPLDLTSSEELVKDYWVLSERAYPSYPVSAAKRKLNGCVVFQYVIDSEGEPQNIKTIKFLPDNTFVSEGKKALKKLRWKPSESNTSAQPVLTTVEWSFTLDDVAGTPDCKLESL